MGEKKYCHVLEVYEKNQITLDLSLLPVGIYKLQLLRSEDIFAEDIIYIE